jgi:hypothetical protein
MSLQDHLFCPAVRQPAQHCLASHCSTEANRRRCLKRGLFPWSGASRARQRLLCAAPGKRYLISLGQFHLFCPVQTTYRRAPVFRSQLQLSSPQ